MTIPPLQRQIVTPRGTEPDSADLSGQAN